MPASLQFVGGNAPDDAVPLASIVRSWTEASLFVARSIGSLIDGQPAEKQQSPRLTNGRRLKDWTGLSPQSDGLFVACAQRAVAMSDRALEG